MNNLKFNFTSNSSKGLQLSKKNKKCLGTLKASSVRVVFKGTVMQIEKVLINDRLRVSKVS